MLPGQGRTEDRALTKHITDATQTYGRGALSLGQWRARIGADPFVSRWISVSQSVIDAFADITQDHQWIHTDPVRAAAETPFGGTIAHGFLTLALLAPMAYDALPEVEDAQMGVNYGLNRLRFLAPVKAGARIRGRFALQAIEERDRGELTCTWAVTVEIEDGDRPAFVAEWINRHYLA